MGGWLGEFCCVEVEFMVYDVFILGNVIFDGLLSVYFDFWIVCYYCCVVMCGVGVYCWGFWVMFVFGWFVVKFDV